MKLRFLLMVFALIPQVLFAFYAEIVPAGPLDLCQGEVQTLEALPQGEEYDYLWSTGEQSRAIEVTESGEYTVTVSDNGGIQSEASVSVTFHPLPEPVISGDTSLYVGENTFLSIVDEYASYTWSNGENRSKTLVFMEGEYSCTVTDFNGCIGSSSVSVTTTEPEFDIFNLFDTYFGSVYIGESKSKDLRITNLNEDPFEVFSARFVRETPDMSFETSAELPYLLQPGASMTFTVTLEPTEEKEYLDYLQIEISKPVYRTYSIEFTGWGIDVIGVKEMQYGLDFRLLPNPAKDNLFLEFESNSAEKVYLDIFDMQGRRIMSKEFLPVTGVRQRIGISVLQEGLFYCLLKQNNMVFSRIFIKM